MHHNPTRVNNLFEKILEKDRNVLLADKVNGILKVVWTEEVNLNSAKIVLNQAAMLVGEGNYDKIILDRKSLKQFEVEARVWIKHSFLAKQANELVEKIAKVAAIDPTDVKGAVYANFINTSIKLIFPSITFSRFEEENAAIEWLTRDLNPG